jgi:hypothetical protein
LNIHPRISLVISQKPSDWSLLTEMGSGKGLQVSSGGGKRLQMECRMALASGKFG